MDGEGRDIQNDETVPWMANGQQNTTGQSDQDGLERSIQWHPSNRQQEGRVIEKQVLKSVGARSHPNSGAGSIKDDGSDEETNYEVKLANKSFTLSGQYLDGILRRSISQGKEAVMIVVFSGAGVRATIKLERER